MEYIMGTPISHSDLMLKVIESRKKYLLEGCAEDLLLPIVLKSGYHHFGEGGYIPIVIGAIYFSDYLHGAIRIRVGYGGRPNEDSFYTPNTKDLLVGDRTYYPYSSWLDYEALCKEFLNMPSVVAEMVESKLGKLSPHELARVTRGRAGVQDYTSAGSSTTTKYKYILDDMSDWYSLDYGVGVNSTYAQGLRDLRSELDYYIRLDNEKEEMVLDDIREAGHKASEDSIKFECMGMAEAAPHLCSLFIDYYDAPKIKKLGGILYVE